MNRMAKGVKYATKAAGLSTHHKHVVGAAIMRGSRLISIGWNSTKTHPYSSETLFNSIHAEMSAIIGTRKSDLSRACIWVVRLSKRGKYLDSYPCKECRKILRAVGINKVAYFRSGEWQTSELIG